MTTPQQLDSSQVSPEVPLNENAAALGQAFLWAHDVTADSGLTVGLAGGTFDGNTVADATVACTDNTTNYVVVNRSSRAVSVSTATTNWDVTTTYGRIARAVFASGVLTWHDERYSAGGIFDHSIAAAGDVTGPGSSTANHVALFDGTSGKLIKDSGLTLAGTNTGDQTSVTGNAGTATALQTARTIGGVSFDGTANITQPFDVTGFYPGVPTASAKVLRVPIARAITLPGNFSGSYFSASANATASTVFDVQKNGSSIGTVTIGAGGTTATFATTSGTAKTFAAGDVLSIIAPASPDATLADPAFVLAATR